MKEKRTMNISSFDGYSLEGKLTLPKGEDEVSKLVVFVHGSGPNTYENRDVLEGTEVYCFETLSNEFSRRGVAFFAYNQRGIHLSDNPPLFYDMNVEEYQTYLPLNSVEDIYYIINELKKDECLQNSDVYLLGVSEGTIISALFAEKHSDKVDALFLWGYVNISLSDTIIWQLSGGSFVPLFKEYFETDAAGRINKEAFESGQKEVLAGLGLGDDAFEVCDANHDGYIDEEEMVALGKSLIGFDSETILTAIEKRNDEWLLDDSTLGGQKFTSGWFLQHIGLRNNMERLPELNLPIFIFHGTLDMNTNIQGVYDVQKRFQELGKSNLKVNIFKGYDHGLGIAQYLFTGVMPESFKAIFDAIDETPLS